MLNTDYTITLKVGDTIRFNGGRKHHKIIHEFENEGTKYLIIKDLDGHTGMEIYSKDWLENINLLYGNVYDGVVEINGQKVRGVGGKVLKAPKTVESKTPKKTSTHLTDFQKFVKLQNSGRINMTDIVTGARLANISEEKYEDIMWHYSEYKAGTRK